MLFAARLIFSYAFAAEDISMPIFRAAITLFSYFRHFAIFILFSAALLIICHYAIIFADSRHFRADTAADAAIAADDTCRDAISLLPFLSLH